MSGISCLSRLELPCLFLLIGLRAKACVCSTKLDVEPVVYKQLKQSMAKQLSHGKERDPDTLKQLRIDIACELYDQLTAGHETSAVALIYLFWEMSKRPDLQTELGEELLTLNPPIVYAAGEAENGESEKTPSPKSIDSLPLLDAIVTETLRLHAPIPGIQPRATPSPACTLAGYPGIPPGIRVYAQAYSLHRNPEVYPDPLSWQPKRWFNANEEMNRWFWAFGSGGRMCVGSNLALQGTFSLSLSLSLSLSFVPHGSPKLIP